MAPAHHHHFGAQAHLFFVLLVLFTVLVSARDVSYAMDYDLVYPDPSVPGTYWTPTTASYKASCTYYGVAFTPRKSGRPDIMVLSVSEGPTYNPPRGLQVLIYNATFSQGNGFVPDARIAAFRVDKTQFITMAVGTSSWEKPLLGISLSRVLRESDRFDFLEGQSYFIAMQVSSPLLCPLRVMPHPTHTHPASLSIKNSKPPH